jgi:hypothetical protein
MVKSEYSSGKGYGEGELAINKGTNTPKMIAPRRIFIVALYHSEG